MPPADPWPTPAELRIKPAAVLEIESYSDEDIAAWDQADALSDQERQQILDRLQS
jgi:hypothetical protein